MSIEPIVRELPAVRVASGFEVRMLSGLAALAPAERAMFADDPERWEYYAACEAAPPPAFTFSAIGAWDGEGLAAAAPVFRLTYGLDTPLQGRWRRLGDWLARTFPRFVKVPVIGLGSPLADSCHLRFAPRLSDVQRRDAMAALLAGLEAHAARERIDILAIKDLEAGPMDILSGPIRRAGFTATASLPVAVLDLTPFKSEDNYIAALSAATRKDIRRKLKGAGAVRVEIRHDICGLEHEIVGLYDETRKQSGVDYGDFEKLSPDYFRNVMETVRPHAPIMLYWLGERLIGFNLLLADRSRLIDKFIGMHYPVAREHNLYVRSWMENVRYCLANGIGLMQTGQTAYASKLRFGSRLDKRWLCFKHRRRVWNWVFAKAGPLIAFDKLDPDLAALAKRPKQ